MSGGVQAVIPDERAAAWQTVAIGAIHRYPSRRHTVGPLVSLIRVQPHLPEVIKQTISKGHPEDWPVADAARKAFSQFQPAASARSFVLSSSHLSRCSAAEVSSARIAG